MGSHYFIIGGMKTRRDFVLMQHGRQNRKGQGLLFRKIERILKKLPQKPVSCPPALIRNRRKMADHIQIPVYRPDIHIASEGKICSGNSRVRLDSIDNFKNPDYFVCHFVTP
ncbi:hypothetical protein D3C71_1963380 [compost metagenome]